MKKLILMIALSFVFTIGYAQTRKEPLIPINLVGIKNLKQTYIEITVTQPISMRHPQLTVAINYNGFYGLAVGTGYVKGRFNFRKFTMDVSVLNYFAKAGYFLVGGYLNYYNSTSAMHKYLLRKGKIIKNIKQ